MQARRVVMTGGPGAGKTALLDALRRRGFPVAPEAARDIIRRRKQQGLSPRPAPIEFAREILHSDVQHYHEIPAQHPRYIFFDRSILDALGMLAELDQLSPRRRDYYLARYPYDVVFILPPWREIYRQDAERDQTYDDAVRVHDWLRLWYVQCGYEPVAVPPAPVEERCRFVLHELAGREPG